MTRQKASPILTNSEVLVYQNAYVRVFDNHVTFPADIKGRYLKFDWVSPYSVAALPVMPNGEILLVDVFRYAANEWSLEIPKGFGRPEMSPIEMAAIELAEEAGLKSDDWQEMGTLRTEAAVSPQKMHIFVARNCQFVGEATPERFEVFGRARAVTRDAAMKLVRAGEITDAVTVASLALYLP